MRLIKLRPITVLNSNVPEENYETYDPAYAYHAGDIVLVQNLEPNGITKKFRSLADNNQGHYPPDNPDFWQDLGATNKWAMFDSYSTTQTVYDGNIQVEIEATKITHVALFNVEGNECTIEIWDNDTGDFINVYDQGLRLDQSLSWSDYFFGEFVFKTALVQQVPYMLGSTRLRITIYGSTTKCGLLAVGYGQYIGCTTFGVRTGIDDYSVKAQLDFGEYYLKQGKFAKKAEVNLEIATGALSKIQKMLADVRATPCIWDLNNENTNEDALIIYGFYKDFEVILSTPSISTCTLSIEGLI